MSESEMDPGVHVLVRDGSGRVLDPAAVQPWRRVVVETPYAGERGQSLRYLRACLRDCLRRGEAPYASHGLYTQLGVLDDGVPAERALGLRAGRLYRSVADVVAIYTDLGISPGMVLAIEEAASMLRRIEYRSLPSWLGSEESGDDESEIQKRVRVLRNSQAAIEAALELAAAGYDLSIVQRELHRHLYGSQAPRGLLP